MNINSGITLGILWVTCVTVVLKQNLWNTFSFRCPFFAPKRNPLFKSLHTMEPFILNFEKNMLTNGLLFGSDRYGIVINLVLLKSTTITYLKSTKCFERPLIDQWSSPILLKRLWEKSYKNVFVFWKCSNACFFIDYSNLHLI